MDDCLKAIELDSANMKAYYFLAQAQLAVNHPNEALNSALTAYEFCLNTWNSSTQAVSGLVLQAKKMKWEAKEKERLRLRSELLREIEDGFNQRRMEELRGLKLQNLEISEMKEEKVDIELSTRKKIAELRNIFQMADPKNMERRVCRPSPCLQQNYVSSAYEVVLTSDTAQEVPDYLIDAISFTVMHDPVITKTGNSYDRATVMEHLKRSHTDPLTREPLRLEDLRPNLALKQACDDFLAANGWAVDY